MKFKKLSTILATTLIATVFAGCAPKTEEQSTDKTLTVGVMGSIDALPLVIAQEKGYFTEEGVSLDLQIFKAAKDRDAALEAGALDGVLCDNVAISIYQNRDIDMKITGTTNGFWTLVAGKDSNINSTTDLKGKKLGISENTMIDYLADYLLLEDNFSVNDAEKVAIPAMPARLEALKAAQIDAAILPAPFNDAAVVDGGKEIKKIYNENIQISVTAFLQNAIDKKGSEIKGFYKAYNKAIDYINSTDIKEYEDLVISTVGYPEEMRGNIVLPTLKQNYLPAEDKVQTVMDWAKNKGLLTKDINAKDVINDIAVK